MERPVHFVVGTYYAVATARPCYHLTYDDGPHPEVTPQVLDALDEHGAKATFFVVADEARRHPELIAEELRRGHEVGLHSRTHPRLTKAGWRQLLDEIKRARHDLEEIAQREIRWFRPPYGAQSLSSLSVVRASRMKTLLWSVDSKDWRERGPDEPLELSVDSVAPGGVVLFHDTPGSREHGELPPPSMPKDELTRYFLDRLAGREMLPVGIDELMESGSPLRKAKLG
jgi:peptidoglycan/xylan/chitin deacetylase (PgdA/CDA1 family)